MFGFFSRQIQKRKSGRKKRGNYDDVGSGEKSILRSSSFLKRKKSKDIDESGVQDDSVIYSESKSSKLNANKRPSRRIESFNIRRPRHSDAGLQEVQKKPSIAQEVRRSSLQAAQNASAINGSQVMDQGAAGNRVSPVGPKHPPPGWASYSDGLNRYRDGAVQGPGRPVSPGPPGPPLRGASTTVVKNLAYQYSNFNTPPGASRHEQSDASPISRERRQANRTGSFTNHDIQRTGSVTSHELEDLIEKYRGNQQPDSWSISSLVTTPPPLPKTPPPPQPSQLSVMPPSHTADTMVMPRSPTQVVVRTKPFYNTSTQTDDLPPSPPPPTYDYPTTQVSYRSIEIQCDMDRDLSQTTVTKMSTLERRRTLKSDVSTQINQALAVLREHQQQQEYVASPRGQQQPEPQRATPVISQPAQWQKLSNIPESNNPDPHVITQKQKQIQDDIIDKINEHSPNQTYMLRKLSQEFFKTRPGYGYINRLQSNSSDSSRPGSTSESSQPGSTSNYESYPDTNINGTHSRAGSFGSQSDYGSRLSLPQHSIGEDSGMFSARTSMSEPSSQLSYHDRSQSQITTHSEDTKLSPRDKHYETAVRQGYARAGSQSDVNHYRDYASGQYGQHTGSNSSLHLSLDQVGLKQDAVYVPSSYQSPDERRQSMDHYENKNKPVTKEYFSDTDNAESSQLSKSVNIPLRGTDSNLYSRDVQENQRPDGYQFSRSNKLSLKKAFGIFEPIDTQRPHRPIAPSSRSKSTSNVPLKASFSNYVDVQEAQRLANERSSYDAEFRKETKNERTQESPQRLKRTSSEQLRPVKERYKDQLNVDECRFNVEVSEGSKDLSQADMRRRGSDHDYCMSSGESSRRSTGSDHRISAGSDVFYPSMGTLPSPSLTSTHSSSSNSSQDERNRISDSGAKKSTKQALLNFFEKKTGKRLSTSSMESGGSAEKTLTRDKPLTYNQLERSPCPEKLPDQETSEHMKKSKSLPYVLDPNANLSSEAAPQKKRPMHRWDELYLDKKSNTKPPSSSVSMDLGSLPSNERSMMSLRNSGRSSHSSMDGTWPSTTSESDRSTYSQLPLSRQEPEPMAPARPVTQSSASDLESLDPNSRTYQVTVNQSYTDRDEEEESTSPPVLPPRNYRTHASGSGFKMPKPLPVTPSKPQPGSNENFDTPKPDKYADQLRAQLRKFNNSQSAIFKPYPMPGKFNLSTSRPVDRQPMPQEARAPQDELSPSSVPRTSPRLQPQSPTSPSDVNSLSPLDRSPQSPDPRTVAEPKIFNIPVSHQRHQSDSVSESSRKSEAYDPRRETPRPWSNEFKLSKSVSKQERSLPSVPDRPSKEAPQQKSNPDLRATSDSPRYGGPIKAGVTAPSLPDLSSRMPRRKAVFQQLVHSTGVQETHFNATVVQTTNDGQVKKVEIASPTNLRESLNSHERSLSNSSRDRLSNGSSSSSTLLSRETSRESLLSRETSRESLDIDSDTMVKEPYRDPHPITPRPRPILSSSDNFEELLDAEAELEKPKSPEVPLKPLKVLLKKHSSQEEKSPTNSHITSPYSSSELLAESPRNGRRLSGPLPTTPPLSVFRKDSESKVDDPSELPLKPPRRPRAHSKEDLSTKVEKSANVTSPIRSPTSPASQSPLSSMLMAPTLTDNEKRRSSPPGVPNAEERWKSPSPVASHLERRSPPVLPHTEDRRRSSPPVPSKMERRQSSPPPPPLPKSEPPIPEPNRPVPQFFKPQPEQTRPQEHTKYEQKSPSYTLPNSDHRKESDFTKGKLTEQEFTKAKPSQETDQVISPEPEKPWAPAISHHRQKSQEEIDYEFQAALVVRHLSPEEKTLGEVILPSPEYKTTASYLRKVYQLSGKHRPSRPSHSSSHHSKNNLDGSSSMENIETLKKDLKERIEEKLDTLRGELDAIISADKVNNAKGKTVTNQIMQANQGATWLEKFKSVVDDTDSVLKLLSNISARLARTENQMLSSSRMDEEKVELIDKKESLEEKWGDAKMLKEAIDNRYSQVRSSLKPDERESFQEFLEYKIIYAMERKEVEELLELGQDQLAALQSSLRPNCDHS